MSYKKHELFILRLGSPLERLRSPLERLGSPLERFVHPSSALVHLSSTFIHPSSALVHPSSASFTPRAPWFTPFVVESVLLIILVFFYVFLVVCLRSVSCAQCWRCPWIVHSWLSLSITSTYIRKILSFITYLVQIKAFLYDQYDRKSTVHIFTPRENNRLLDYYKIISISRRLRLRLRPILVSLF